MSAWDPVTEGDRIAQAIGQHGNCCGTAEWRGRLCQYHQGWADGWDEHAEQRVDSAIREVAVTGPDATCPACEGHGEVDEGSYYEPMVVPCVCDGGTLPVGVTVRINPDWRMWERSDRPLPSRRKTRRKI